MLSEEAIDYSSPNAAREPFIGGLALEAGPRENLKRFRVPAHASLASLRATVLAATPFLVPTSIRLLFFGSAPAALLPAGNLVVDNGLLFLLKRAVAESPRILTVRVMGSRVDEADAWSAVQAAAPAISARVRDDALTSSSGGALLKPTAIFTSERFVAHARDMAARRPSERWGFGAVRPLLLPGVDVDRSREVLQELAMHAGVLAVMKARRWFVPVLAEMFPSGSVGVDPVCVLGLNVNSGQEIQLRLRTDDLAGWRKRGVVMKTLWHELAHNEMSEHTGAFYDLVSALTREGEAADWTTGEGHRLDGDAVSASAAIAARGVVEIAPHTASSRPELMPPLVAGGGRVGGEVARDVVAATAAAARVRAAAAAEVAAYAARAAATASRHVTTVEADAQTPIVGAPKATTSAIENPARDRESVVAGPGLLPVRESVLPAQPAPTLVAPSPEAFSDALSVYVGTCLSGGVPLRDALDMLVGICERAGAALDDAAAGRTSEASSRCLRLRPNSAALARRAGGGLATRALLIAAGFAPASSSSSSSADEQQQEEEILIADKGSRAQLAHAHQALVACLASV